MARLHRLEEQKRRHKRWQYVYVYSSLGLGIAVLVGLGMLIGTAALSAAERFWGMSSGLGSVLLSLGVGNYGNHLVHARLRQARQTQARQLVTRLSQLCLGLRDECVCIYPVLLDEAQLLSLELLPLGRWYAEKVEFRLTQSVLDNLFRQCGARK